MSEAKKTHPYGHLSDRELSELVAGAVDFRLRAAELNPGEVKQTLISYGCPPSAAERMVSDPLMRPMAARFHLDTLDLVLGDRDARERVERVCQGWAGLRERGAPESPEEARREAELDRRYGR